MDALPDVRVREKNVLAMTSVGVIARVDGEHIMTFCDKCWVCVEATGRAVVIGPCFVRADLMCVHGPHDDDFDTKSEGDDD